MLFDYLGQNLFFDLPFLSSLVWLVYKFYYLKIKITQNIFKNTVLSYCTRFVGSQIARWILLLQEFNYKVVVKLGKSNSNADFMSRLRREEAVGDIQAEFPDEFSDDQDRKEEMVFHLNGEEPSEFDDVISYIANHIYPPGLNMKEKSVSNTKWPSTV